MIRAMCARKRSRGDDGQENDDFLVMINPNIAISGDRGAKVSALTLRRRRSLLVRSEIYILM
jgi:hypothetical protein